MYEVKMYQVSTLQALMLGYTRKVIDVAELKKHGDTGLGTFVGVDGEMIMIDGECYRALEDGTAVEADEKLGVPFSSVCNFSGSRNFKLPPMDTIDKLKVMLNNRIEEHFGLNSMHVARIDGQFRVVHARSESAYHAHHVTLKDMLSETQKSFRFDNVMGTLICVYYPDYMDGINAPGWHMHFISDDRTKGGHVFEIDMLHGHASLDKITKIELQLPYEPAFDTYALKTSVEDDIKKVEQGKE